MQLEKAGPASALAKRCRAGVINPLPSVDSPTNTASKALLQASHVQRRAHVSPLISRLAASLAFAVPEKWGRDNG